MGYERPSWATSYRQITSLAFERAFALTRGVRGGRGKGGGGGVQTDR